MRENLTGVAKEVEPTSNTQSSCVKQEDYYSIKSKRCIGYVYGGTTAERQKIVKEFKEEDKCYMTLASPRVNKKFLEFIKKEHSGTAIIVCLYRKSGFVEYLR